MKKRWCREAVNFALFISLGCQHYESIKEEHDEKSNHAQDALENENTEETKKEEKKAEETKSEERRNTASFLLTLFLLLFFLRSLFLPYFRFLGRLEHGWNKQLQLQLQLLAPETYILYDVLLANYTQQAHMWHLCLYLYVTHLLVLLIGVVCIRATKHTLAGHRWWQLGVSFPINLALIWFKDLWCQVIELSFWRPLLAQWNPDNPIIDGEETCKFVQSLWMMLFLFRPKILLCCVVPQDDSDAIYSVPPVPVLDHMRLLIIKYYLSHQSHLIQYRLIFIQLTDEKPPFWNEATAACLADPKIEVYRFIHDCCWLEKHNRVFAMRLICGNSTCVQRSMLH